MAAARLVFVDESGAPTQMPSLQRDAVVILDHLATHKVAGVRAAIAATGARLAYLPPYSPDFNPIENLWSKVKPRVKRRAPRTARQLFSAAGAAFATVPPKTATASFDTPVTLRDLQNRSNLPT